MKIHHIGYLVKNIEKSEKEFTKLGYIVEREAVYDSIRDCNISFLKNGEYRVELVNPASNCSPIFSLLEKYKDSPYHICYEVDGLEKIVEQFLEGGYFILKDVEKAPALDNRNVVFLYKKNLGMIEVLEQL